MSHSSIQIHFPDGEIWFGEANRTAEQMQTGIFKTSKERDAQWRSLEWHYCDCDGEIVVCREDPDGSPAWVGRACRAHRCYCGPFGLEMEDDNPLIHRIIERWDDPNPQTREYIREYRITLPKAFRPLIEEIFQQVKDRKPEAEEIDCFVHWVEDRPRLVGGYKELRVKCVSLDFVPVPPSTSGKKCETLTVGKVYDVVVTNIYSPRHFPLVNDDGEKSSYPEYMFEVVEEKSE